ncbi:MAG: CopG family transcriptional regulator [Myxococcota bacterium]
MVRTQVQLTEAQSRALRTVARRRGISFSEAVRRCVDRGLEQEAPDRRDLYARALKLAGKFKDRRGARDLATHHDKYLDKAFD